MYSILAVSNYITCMVHVHIVFKIYMWTVSRSTYCHCTTEYGSQLEMEVGV